MKKLLLSLLLIPTIAYAAVTFPVNGGTGTSTKPTIGQILLGLSNGTYAPVATSSLGITSGITYTGSYPIIVSGSVISTGFSTSTTNVFSGTNTFNGQLNFGLASGTSLTLGNLFSTSTLFLNGLLRDSTNASGTRGMILSSTGTSTLWIATSSLGISNSINGWATTTFIFATSSDTNIGLNITTSTSAITFIPTWIGTLADGRIASAATWNAKLGSLFSVASGTGLTIGNFFSTSTMTVTGTATFSSTTSFTGTSNRFNVSSTTGATIGTLFATSSATIATSSFTGNMTITTGTYVPRVLGYASNASTTFDVFNVGDGGIATTTITATTTIVNPTGTYLNGLMFEMWFKATTTQGLFWGTNFASSTDVNLPTQIASGTTKVIVEYRQDSNKLECMYVNKTFAN